jgi:putative inorganic carbon (hco3(-)) transporter
MPKVLSSYLPASLVDEGPSRVIFLVLALSIAMVLVSIAVSQLLLVTALLGRFWQSRREGWTGLEAIATHPARPRYYLGMPPIAWPLLFFFLWTILAALVSDHPLKGLTISKKFFIFLLLFLVPLVLQGRGKTAWIYHAVFLVAGLSSALGLGQFIANPDRSFLDRISGFMGQWMTYSGLQMLVLVMLCAYASYFSWRRRWWILPLSVLLAGSLYLTFTRNAWLGAAAGIAAVLCLTRPRAVALFALLLLALLIFAPQSAYQRLRAGLDPGDTTTRGRIELVQTSLRLIRDNPWFGVGPKSVNTEALRYRGSQEFPDWMYQHMHNNFLQIAAERGIPGLLLWIWFMIQLVRDPIQVFRGRASPDHQSFAIVASVAAVGSWLALMVAGMFEYNFGDSEILTLFLFIMSAPNAAQLKNESA